MSINKILNRPMFRQAALKKGHLKPIRAFDGRFIGPMPFNAPVPVGSPTGGPIPTNPRTQLMNVPQPVQQGMIRRGLGAIGRNVFSLPFYIGSDLTYKALDAGESGKNLSTGAKLTGAGIGGALTAYGASRLLPAAMGMGFVPGAIALGLYEGGNQLVRAGIRERKRIKAMSPAELAEFKRLNRARALAGEADVSDEDLGLTDAVFKPKTKKKRKIVTQANPGAGRPGSRFQTDRADNLTQADNETKIGNENVVDITKVAQNTGGIAPVPPSIIGAKDTVAEKGFKLPDDKPTKVVTDDKKDPNQNVLQNTGQTSAGTGKGKVNAGDGTPVTDDTIARAKQIRKELLDGRSSQAKLVFLANLAAGLMSGTTAKAGIGGALEVFGKALGPAVNNYATVKLKENELENDLMSDALELASDEIEARNALLEGRTGLDFEKFGIIQFRDINGNPINRTGGLLKNGTYVVANLGQANEDGSQPYSIVPVGSFNKFIESSFAEKNQGEVIKSLAGKYKALGIGKETIRILEDAAAEGKTLGGPKGRLALITTRLQSALSDFDINIGDYQSGLAKAEDMRDDFKTQLMNDGLSEDAAEKFLNDNFGSIDSQFKKIMKEMNMFKDETTAANLERLAINETVLTYALANSLKDKDRLTQKDIQMAQQLVNVFPFFRGSGQVVRSLEAVNERILGDIRSSELAYGEFGGDTATITNFRRQYGLLPQIEGQTLDVGFTEDTTADLLEKLGTIK